MRAACLTLVVTCLLPGTECLIMVICIAFGWFMTRDAFLFPDKSSIWYASSTDANTHAFQVSAPFLRELTLEYKQEFTVSLVLPDIGSWHNPFAEYSCYNCDEQLASLQMLQFSDEGLQRLKLGEKVSVELHLKRNGARVGRSQIFHLIRPVKPCDLKEPLAALKSLHMESDEMDVLRLKQRCESAKLISLEFRHALTDTPATEIVSDGWYMWYVRLRYHEPLFSKRNFYYLMPVFVRQHQIDRRVSSIGFDLVQSLSDKDTNEMLWSAQSGWCDYLKKQARYRLGTNYFRTWSDQEWDRERIYYRVLSAKDIHDFDQSIEELLENSFYAKYVDDKLLEQLQMLDKQGGTGKLIYAASGEATDSDKLVYTRFPEVSPAEPKSSVPYFYEVKIRKPVLLQFMVNTLCDGDIGQLQRSIDLIPRSFDYSVPHDDTRVDPDSQCLLYQVLSQPVLDECVMKWFRYKKWNLIRRMKGEIPAQMHNSFYRLASRPAFMNGLRSRLDAVVENTDFLHFFISRYPTESVPLVVDLFEAAGSSGDVAAVKSVFENPDNRLRLRPFWKSFEGIFYRAAENPNRTNLLACMVQIWPKLVRRKSDHALKLALQNGCAENVRVLMGREARRKQKDYTALLRNVKPSDRIRVADVLREFNVVA